MRSGRDDREVFKMRPLGLPTRIRHPLRASARRPASMRASTRVSMCCPDWSFVPTMVLAAARM